MSGSERPVLVHIGLHKTGTSWLKTHLFRRDPFVEVLTVPEVMDEVVRPLGLDYEPGRVRSLVAERVGGLSAGARPYVATERLSGIPHAGSHDQYVIADRLIEVIPGARFVMVFREQEEMLASLYYQYVRRGGSCKLREYVRTPKDRKLPLFDLRVLEYDRLVGYYLDRVGPDRVLALPYEAFRSDAAAFVRSITAFADADRGQVDELPLGKRVNKRGALAETFVRRWLNAHITRRSASLNQRSVDWSVLHPLDRALCAAAKRSPSPVERRLKQAHRREIHSLIGDRFKESNERLAAMLDVDLSAHGYTIG